MPLDESEGGEWKTGLQLIIEKTKIMASGPITSLFSYRISVLIKLNIKIQASELPIFIFRGRRKSSTPD